MIINYFGAVVIRMKMRPMERTAYYKALETKKLKGVCVCSSALYGNAASRMSEVVPSDATHAYGGYHDIDHFYAQQARETDNKKREVVLPRSSSSCTNASASAPIYQYIWPSGIGPRVAERALMLINPYPRAAPLEEVRLKRP